MQRDEFLERQVEKAARLEVRLRHTAIDLHAAEGHAGGFGESPDRGCQRTRELLRDLDAGKFDAPRDDAGASDRYRAIPRR
jgi:hypothetical protein